MIQQQRNNAIALFALICACIGYLGQVHITSVPNGTVPAYVGEAAPRGMTLGGYTYCNARTDIVVEQRFAYWGGEVMAHELLHAVDCADDGILNGSPIPGYPATIRNAGDPMHVWTDWALAHPADATALVNNLSR